MAGTDQALIAQAKAGDTAAFEAILAPLIEPAHRFACGLLQDTALAEDAVQEASLNAWRKLHQLRPDSAMRPWFLGIVANQCRSQRRGRWWSPSKIPDSTRATHDPARDATHRATVRAAVLKLSVPEREVVVLRLFLDLPWDEVAALSGLTEAGARSRLNRALSRLRIEDSEVFA